MSENYKKQLLDAIADYNKRMGGDGFNISFILWKLILIIIFLGLILILALAVILVIGYIIPDIFEYYEDMMSIFKNPAPIIVVGGIVSIFMFYWGRVVHRKAKKEVNDTFLMRSDDMTPIAVFFLTLDWAALTFYSALSFSRKSMGKNKIIELNNNDLNTVILIYEALENKQPMSYGDYIKEESIKEISFNDKKKLLDVLVELNLYNIFENPNSKTIRKVGSSIPQKAKQN